MKTSSLIAAVILTAVVVGAGTYYLQEQRIQQLGQELADMNVQMKEIQEASKPVEPEVEPMEEEKPVEPEGVETSDLEELLPVITFTPSGLFDDAMRQELQEKVIDPYFDYHNDKELDFITMQIELLPEGESLHDYMYAIEAVSKNGIYHGFLHGTYGEALEYYVPECMGLCPFTDEYKKKYPHVVADE